MSYTVALYRDNTLSDIIKYRNGFAVASEFTTTVVDIGNFQNKDIFCDNSVELACGDLTTGAQDRSLNVNIIIVSHGNNIVLGHITNQKVINDNNILFSYRVDAYMSALISGKISGISGVCARTNIATLYPWTNCQAEPISMSDVSLANNVLTENLNQAVFALENIAPNADGTMASNMTFVLLVSYAVIEHLGVSAWALDPAASAVLREKTVLFHYHDATFPHCGGQFKGVPLRFSSVGNVNNFLRTICGGAGFRTTMNANGWSIQNAVTHRSYLTDLNTGAGQTNYGQTGNLGSNAPFEAIRFITAADIYACYFLPTTFAVNRFNHFTSTVAITGFKNLANLTGWGAEDSTKNKLLTYPYYYARLVTCNGDSVNIIPQTHFLPVTGSTTDYQISLSLRFIGGDTPRLMGRISTRGNEGYSIISTSAATEWFTIRNYPSIQLTIDNIANRQAARDMENTRKITSVYTNARIAASIDSPIKQGYFDGITGGDSTNSAQSGTNRAGAMLGKAIGAVDALATNLGFGNPNQGGGLFANEAAAQAMQAYNTATAGNFFTPDVVHIMGNDFLSSLGEPAFAAYDCGGTPAEHFAAARYFDRFGQSCGFVVNPLTNVGNLFAGAAAILPATNGRTFYQFADIEVTGFMPQEWRLKIKQLFESGVYLINGSGT